MEVTELMVFAAEKLDRLGIEYAIVGSCACGVWGDSRTTRDVDIVVRLDIFDAARIYNDFSSDDFYVSLPAAEEAVERQSQFNIIDNNTSNKIDFMLAKDLPWSEAQLTRRKWVQVQPDRSAYFAAPEDVIIGKLIYYQDGGSDKHLRDIASILRQSGDLVDREYIATHAQSLGLTDIWQMVQAAADKRD